MSKPTGAPILGIRRFSPSPKENRGRSGQSILEFAIILPIFLVILAAIADLGLMYLTAQTVRHASREGARFAVQIEDLETNDQRVKNHINDYYTPDTNLFAGFSEGITNTGISNCAVSDEVTVTITGVYHFLALNLIGLDSAPLSLSTTMRYELCEL
jgi:Flp pilus assembly protein TadG